ncbi:MAG: hypothetical protein ACFCGT_02045 [Sandaracinaceae bacterium]
MDPFRRLAALAGLSALAQGCITFPVTVPLQEQRLVGTPLAAEVGALPLDIAFDVNAEAVQYGLERATRVRLLELELRITPSAEDDGHQDDFLFLDRAELYAEPVDARSSLPTVLVAEAEAPIDDGRTLPFVTDATVDLKPYLEEGASGRTAAFGLPPADDLTFDGTVVLGVELF